MPWKTPDRVKQTATTTGTGDFTLSGSITGSVNFSAVCTTGDTVPYVIQLVDGAGAPAAEWEVGHGTYSGANTLTRTSVLASSNAGALVNFSAGTKQVWIGFNGTMAGWLRERLMANRTYYVRTDGSDSNNGLANTIGGAFLTIPKAIDVICNTLDISSYDVTVQLGDGTYTAGAVFKDIHGNGTVTIQGNSGTPANVIISTTSANAIESGQYSRGYWAIKDLKVQTTTSGRGILCQRGGFLTFSNIVFGACATAHIEVNAGSTAICVGNYSISGAAPYHFSAQYGGYLACSGRTITITGTPAFSSAFAFASSCGSISSSSCTFSGSATGVRYSAVLNGVIDSIGGGASYFPGNSAGTTATGGQYA